MTSSAARDKTSKMRRNEDSISLGEYSESTRKAIASTADVLHQRAASLQLPAEASLYGLLRSFALGRNTALASNPTASEQAADAPLDLADPMEALEVNSVSKTRQRLSVEEIDASINASCESTDGQRDSLLADHKKIWSIDRKNRIRHGNQRDRRYAPSLQQLSDMLKVARKEQLSTALA